MTDQLDTVIARIRKLMALTAARGASEAEAALAAEHVQRLLAEHNLSMSAVEASGAQGGEGSKRTRENVARRQVYKWQRELMASVAELNFCKAFTRWQPRGWGKPDIFDGYDLIGREVNVASTRVMFEYLLQTIERLARDDVLDPSQYFTRYAHSFKEGCSDRLVERLREKREDIVAEQERKVKEAAARARHPGAAPSNLPTVILRDVIQNEADLNQDFEQGLKPGTTAQERANREAEYQANLDKAKKRIDDAIARGLSEDAAYYVGLGYDDARAVELAAPRAEKPAKPETDAQRRKRQQREANERDRYRRQHDRAASRLDNAGYRKGKQAGENVSLDRQLNSNERGKLL